MGTSICRDGAAQDKMPCNSLEEGRPEMCQKQPEGKFIQSMLVGSTT